MLAAANPSPSSTDVLHSLHHQLQQQMELNRTLRQQQNQLINLTTQLPTRSRQSSSTSVHSGTTPVVLATVVPESAWNVAPPTTANIPMNLNPLNQLNQLNQFQQQQQTPMLYPSQATILPPNEQLPTATINSNQLQQQQSLPPLHLLSAATQVAQQLPWIQPTTNELATQFINQQQQMNTLMQQQQPPQHQQSPHQSHQQLQPPVPFTSGTGSPMGNSTTSSNPDFHASRSPYSSSSYSSTDLSPSPLLNQVNRMSTTNSPQLTSQPIGGLQPLPLVNLANVMTTSPQPIAPLSELTNFNTPANLGQPLVATVIHGSSHTNGHPQSHSNNTTPARVKKELKQESPPKSTSRVARPVRKVNAIKEEKKMKEVDSDEDDDEDDEDQEESEGEEEEDEDEEEDEPRPKKRSNSGNGNGKATNTKLKKEPLSRSISTSSTELNSNGKPKRMKGVSCHQCKTRRGADLYHCGMAHIKKPTGARQRRRKKERMCRKKYCARCLEKFYGEPAPPRQKATEINMWACPGCRGLCTCAACKRGVSKKEIVYPAAVLEHQAQLRAMAIAAGRPPPVFLTPIEMMEQQAAMIDAANLKSNGSSQVSTPIFTPKTHSSQSSTASTSPKKSTAVIGSNDTGNRKRKSRSSNKKTPPAPSDSIQSTSNATTPSSATSTLISRRSPRHATRMVDIPSKPSLPPPPLSSHSSTATTVDADSVPDEPMTDDTHMDMDEHHALPSFQDHDHLGPGSALVSPAYANQIFSPMQQSQRYGEKQTMFPFPPAHPLPPSQVVSPNIHYSNLSLFPHNLSPPTSFHLLNPSSTGFSQPNSPFQLRRSPRRGSQPNILQAQQRRHSIGLGGMELPELL